MKREDLSREVGEVQLFLPFTSFEAGINRLLVKATTQEEVDALGELVEEEAARRGEWGGGE